MSEIEDTLGNVNVDIEVVLGTTQMPVHQILRMGRGAVIELNATETDDVTIVANNVAVAKAGIIVNHGRICISITKLLRRPQSLDGLSIQDVVADQAEALRDVQAEMAAD